MFFHLKSALIDSLLVELKYAPPKLEVLMRGPELEQLQNSARSPLCKGQLERKAGALASLESKLTMCEI